MYTTMQNKGNNRLWITFQKYYWINMKYMNIIYNHIGILRTRTETTSCGNKFANITMQVYSWYSDVQ